MEKARPDACPSFISSSVRRIVCVIVDALMLWAYYSSFGKKHQSGAVGFLERGGAGISWPGSSQGSMWLCLAAR